MHIHLSPYTPTNICPILPIGYLLFHYFVAICFSPTILHISHADLRAPPIQLFRV
ncbi:MAG: hypothetical protein K6T34_03390 [Thermoflavifilum sp.]|nr:hypothetical protein [Thermoflavifilum sp.]